MAVHHHYQITLALDMSAQVGVVKLHVGLTTGRAQLGPFTYGGSGSIQLDKQLSQNADSSGGTVLMGSKTIDEISNAVFTPIPNTMTEITFDIKIAPYPEEGGKLHIGLWSSIGDKDMPTSSSDAIDPSAFGWITWDANGQNFQNSNEEAGTSDQNPDDSNFTGTLTVVQASDVAAE